MARDLTLLRVLPHDLTGVIDPPGNRGERTGEIDRGERFRGGERTDRMSIIASDARSDGPPGMSDAVDLARNRIRQGAEVVDWPLLRLGACAEPKSYGQDKKRCEAKWFAI